MILFFHSHYFDRKYEERLAAQREFESEIDVNIDNRVLADFSKTRGEFGEYSDTDTEEFIIERGVSTEPPFLSILSHKTFPPFTAMTRFFWAS